LTKVSQDIKFRTQYTEYKEKSMPPETEPRPLGKQHTQKKIKADLKRYCQLALQLGASGAVIISAEHVSVDERVRLKCLIPRCNRAGETPNCPPNAPDLELFRRAINLYSWAILFRYDINNIEDYVPVRGKTTTRKKQPPPFFKKNSEIVDALERQAYKDGYHLALGLGGGSCKDYLCLGQPCQFQESGQCRHPLHARPSMEAMGIDVVKLIDEAGWQSYTILDDLKSTSTAITVGMVFIY
jgi:predicted metal-binding protein